MKTLPTSLLLLIFTSLNSQSVQFQDFFTLKKDASKRYYVSHIIDGDTTRAKTETYYCRSMVVKNKEIFYFENGTFFFSPLFWKYDIKNANIDFFEPLFPAFISINTKYTYRDGSEKYTYRFAGNENIIIRGRKYEDCLKLIVTKDWSTAQETDTVWFKREIGLVKWLRSTGRLEELKGL